jgi:hypothetical protein
MNDQHGAVFLLRGTVGERLDGPDVGSLGLREEAADEVGEVRLGQQRPRQRRPGVVHPEQRHHKLSGHVVGADGRG